MAQADIFEVSPPPRRFRGYDCEWTEKLLAEIEMSYRALLQERNESRTGLAAAEARIAELEREVATDRERREAVGEALVRAARVEAESRKAAETILAEAERDAEALRAATHARLGSFAEEFVREAREGIAARIGELLDQFARRSLIAVAPAGGDELRSSSRQSRLAAVDEGSQREMRSGAP